MRRDVSPQVHLGLSFWGMEVVDVGVRDGIRKSDGGFLFVHCDHSAAICYRMSLMLKSTISSIEEFSRAARLLYPKYGRLFNHVNHLFMCLPQCQHSTTRKRRCRMCFGFKVCQHHSLAWPIAYYCWLCLSACKDSKELTSDSTGNYRCRQPHYAPF